jgi:large subunit ribosomal protein L6
MARFGKLPVLLPDGVEAKIERDTISIKGPKGELTRKIHRVILVEKEGQSIVVKTKKESKEALSLQGTTRSHILNMIKGVTLGWSKALEIVGAGYRAEVNNRNLVMHIGYSHPVVIEAPEGVNFKVEKSVITVEGIDKDAVGQTAAIIRSKRKPEPYKGSGIKYQDEIIRRKAGKQATKAA